MLLCSDMYCKNAIGMMGVDSKPVQSCGPRQALDRSGAQSALLCNKMHLDCDSRP